MNYLTHVYLSGSNSELAIGNFITYYVKGKAYLDYPEGIQRGILLHRKIDNFTDSHVLFKKNVSILFPKYRHYSRVIVDMFFDYFLVAKWESFHSKSLESFSINLYQTIAQYLGILPEKQKNNPRIIS